MNKVNALSTVLATMGGVSISVASLHNSMQFEDNLIKPNKRDAFIVSMVCSTVGGAMILGAGLLQLANNLSHR